MGYLFNIFSESLYCYVFLQVDAWGLCTGMTQRVGMGRDGGDKTALCLSLPRTLVKVQIVNCTFWKSPPAPPTPNASKAEAER